MAGDDKAPMRVASKISSTKFQKLPKSIFPKRFFPLPMSDLFSLDEFLPGVQFA
jgi:hypothetical protein